MKTSPLAVESAVKQRYAAGAQTQDVVLCRPVNYDPRYLEVIPQEVIERDYGFGDPSKYLRQGETVLGLGSGTGKICFIAAEVVGPEGKVIGVDMTDAMLDVARRNAPVVAEIFRVLKLGGRTVISDIASDEEVPEELQLDPELAYDATTAAAKCCDGGSAGCC